MQWEKLFFQGKEEISEEIKSIRIDLIRTNPYQPRENFENEKIMELAQSIKTYGLLQPIIVARENNGFCVVAGERRLLACKALGWTEIPAIVRDYKNSSLAAVSLIENIQRENLNFIEEAMGYKKLMEEFNLTQEVLAQRLGKSQSTIANKLRLLKLPEEIKQLVKEEKLTERHARALLKLPSPEKQKEAVKVIMEMGMNVKETEKLVEEMINREKNSKSSVTIQRKVLIRDLRIFLNTIRQAVQIIRRAGINPYVEELECDDFWEIRIRLPKNKN